MIERKILNKLNQKDLNDFIEILNDYINFQKNNVNPLYFHEDAFNFCDWLKNEFVNRDIKDFIVVGLYIENKLKQIMIGYKIEVAWNKKIIEDTIPFYTIGLTYFKDINWKIPGEKIVNLDEVVTEHFESQGFTKGFITIKASSFIIKNNDNSKIIKYIDDHFTKTFKQNKHTFSIEKIFKNQEDINLYKFRGFKAFLPRRIKRPVVLLSFELKPEFRNY